MQIYTIGHSNHTGEDFIALLKMHGITAVCDVRSSPYSKFNPQYNRETLQKELKVHDIAYVYLGKELGPRSDDPACYVDGRVQYDRLARTDLFSEGLDRIYKGSEEFAIVLMCSEKDPMMCHRMILICRHLRGNDTDIKHIREDGSLEDNHAVERRLMKALDIPELALFETPEELVEQAYDKQSEKIAYQLPPNKGDA